MSLIRYPKDPQSGFAARMMALLRDAGVDCVAGHEAIEIHTALGLVAAGLGFTLVGRSVADGNRSDIAFVPITGIKGTGTIVAVTRKDDDSALVSSFLSALQAPGD
ncbi:HTH-type transcriptional regulator BenM [compost metagenome]